MCVPGRTRFFRVSTPTVAEAELTRRMLADSSAAWPVAAHRRSWRSYFLSFSEGPWRIGGVCAMTSVIAAASNQGRDGAALSSMSDGPLSLIRANLVDRVDEMMCPESEGDKSQLVCWRSSVSFNSIGCLDVDGEAD
jgi:hypothetical protein